MYNALGLYAGNLGSIPGTSYGALSTTRSDTFVQNQELSLSIAKILLLGGSFPAMQWMRDQT